MEHVADERADGGSRSLSDASGPVADRGRVRAIALATVRGFRRDDCTHLAAASAFYIFFAIFPLAIFAAALSATVSHLLHLNLFTIIMRALTSVLPPSAQEAIRKPLLTAVSSSRHGGLLSFGIATALWSASAAVGALITALNRAYHVTETRPFWRRKALEIVLTLFLSLLVAVAFALVIFGGKIGSTLAAAAGQRTAFTVIWRFVRGAVAVIFILGALAVLYWIGPNRRSRFRWLSPGAVLATLVWFVAINGFGFYASHSSQYSVTYGTLGGVIVLLLALFLSAAIVLVGGELNSAIEQRGDGAPRAARISGRRPRG